MNLLHHPLSVRSGPAPNHGPPLEPLRLPGIRRAIGYIAVPGIGLAIGTLLGLIAALMSGLIMLC